MYEPSYKRVDGEVSMSQHQKIQKWHEQCKLLENPMEEKRKEISGNQRSKKVGTSDWRT